MSTKAIRRALGLVSGHERIPTGDELRAAHVELEAIERAAKDWCETEGQLGPGRMQRLGALLESIAKDAP